MSSTVKSMDVNVRIGPMVPGEPDAERDIGEDRYANVLHQIRQPGWVEIEEVCILRQVIPSVWKMLPVVDVALTFAYPLLPNNYRQDIILWTQKLNSQIDTMSNYFSTTVEVEAELLQHKAKIQEGLEISLAIAATNSSGEWEKLVHKLTPLFCDSQQLLISALRAVISELTSRSGLLEGTYERTNGHWPKVKTFVDPILPLIVGALIVTAVYETWTSSTKKAIESLQLYTAQMEEIEKKIQNVFDRCKSEFKQNMLKDLNEALESSAANEAAVNNLSALMSEKYDWLVNHCIICSESIHLNYCFDGNHVKSLEHNGKFGVIFYRDSKVDETVAFEKWNKVASELEKLAKSFSAYSSAEDLCKKILDTYRTAEHEVCACAVMRPKAALQWIPYYGTPAMLAYATSMGTLKRKGSCGTICETSLNDPLRINPLDVVFFPVGIPLVATETAVDHFREAGGKARYFFVMYK